MEDETCCQNAIGENLRGLFRNFPWKVQTLELWRWYSAVVLVVRRQNIQRSYGFRQTRRKEGLTDRDYKERFLATPEKFK